MDMYFGSAAFGEVFKLTAGLGLF